jgi:hypothetical protein
MKIKLKEYIRYFPFIPLLIYTVLFAFFTLHGNSHLLQMMSFFMFGFFAGLDNFIKLFFSPQKLKFNFTKLAFIMEFHIYGEVQLHQKITHTVHYLTKSLKQIAYLY